MANPTTNFGWVMPTSTSLVTNLPADFNTFGQGVDTSMAQLKGGTTGQILSKTSATDMAFTWITPNPGDITGVTAGTGISGGGTSGDVTITNSMATAMTTKGDLVPATGSGTFSRLAVGTNGQTLMADSTTATGLKWDTPASGATLLSTTTVSGTSTTISSISGSYNHLRIYMTDITSNIVSTLMYKVNGITSGYYGFYLDAPGASLINTSTTNAIINAMGSSGKGNYQFELPNYAVATNMRPVRFFGSNDHTGNVAFGTYNNVGSSAAITSFTLTTVAGTATLTGTIKIYGVTA